MEDFSSVSEDKSTFGIYDGFGGQSAAEYLSLRLTERMSKVSSCQLQSEIQNLYSEFGKEMKTKF